ncbi:Secreted beta-glucosidase sun1 [Escovopsis weberi]|uniref:Secreted beta-glucosidase sun1 n=1 Tax=Escovopsis weberi TaxID=150374 RepID=A0A0M8N6J7_ESCWE|nr:Secreted beta-glucosidase sun1 [Escovopsis weberi]
MVTLLKYTLAATLAVGAANASHNRQLRHVKKHAHHQVEKRGDGVQYADAPVATVYELDGKILTPDEAKKGLAGGDFIVIAEPSEISGGGVSSEFPSGKIKCSEFPSQWGAVALNWLGFSGWSGLQFVPEYAAGASSISDIITGIAGQSCTPGCMCSYACPVGFQKTQWPDAQGSTKQSIGGLYCNSEGYLELTRSSSKTLCEPGEGGVSIQNDLDELVSTCRTDYPGTESMVIPAVADPGATVPLCNPDQGSYYQWQNLGTSAQYYVNKKGVTPDKGCVWNSPDDHDSRGNWAPIICGVGKAADGITYLSIFQNLPTSNAKLDFNIEITGDVNSKCSYIDGEWTGGDNGCTTGMQPGGKAIIRYF